MKKKQIRRERELLIPRNETQPNFLFNICVYFILWLYIVRVLDTDLPCDLICVFDAYYEIC